MPRSATKSICSATAQLSEAISPALLAMFFSLFLAAGQQAQARGPESVADLAEGLQDSVVNISTTQKLTGSRGIPLPRVPEGSPFEEFFEEFFNRRQGPGRGRKKINSLGSGFVIHPSGLIVTNNHVIEGADEIVINFANGTKLKVNEIIGHDSKTDLALLRVTPRTPLKAVKFGNSEKIRVGDWVMAIGNPFGLGGSVSVGIVSATKRDINSGPYDDFIQTDAAINRGNSGGPLFDMEGNVIGVNTAIFSPTGGSIGIGFAIPSNTAKHVLDQLKRWGETRRGWLGVNIQTVTEGIAKSLGMERPRGALIAKVTKDGPAAVGGLMAGDVVLVFNGKPVDTMRALPRLVARAAIGETVEVEVMRKGENKKLSITIGRMEEGRRKVAATRKRPVIKRKKTQVLGLSIAPLDGPLRDRYKIRETIKGVVVTGVTRDSTAARKNIKPGDVIVEVTQQEVASAQDVSERVATLKKSGLKSVLLLISDGRGELRFVALPIDAPRKLPKNNGGTAKQAVPPQ